MLPRGATTQGRRSWIGDGANAEPSRAAAREADTTGKATPEAAAHRRYPSSWDMARHCGEAARRLSPRNAGPATVQATIFAAVLRSTRLDNDDCWDRAGESAAFRDCLGDAGRRKIAYET